MKQHQLVELKQIQSSLSMCWNHTLYRLIKEVGWGWGGGGGGLYTQNLEVTLSAFISCTELRCYLHLL